MQRLRILHEDGALVAVDKPAGFHSHPPEDKSVRLSHRWNSLGILEKQVGQKLYPVHRLDRATSGVLVFSKRRELNDHFQRQFRERRTEKTYFCLVRGHLRGEARFDRKLKRKDGTEADSLTLASELVAFTLPLPGPDGKDRAFTIVKAVPETGRYHQIRRHLAGASLPIVGDKQHGDKKLNRAFAALTGIDGMMLRCLELGFIHPETGEKVRVRAPWGRDWQETFNRAGACAFL